MEKQAIAAFAATNRRVIIDLEKLISNAEKTNQLPASRFLSLAKTELTTARHWLGRTANEIGSTDPYPESRNTASKKIEKMYDTDPVITEKDVADFEKLDIIGKLKGLRLKLNSMATEIKTIVQDLDQNSVDADIFLFHSLMQAYTAAMQSNHWFGEELGSMRSVSASSKAKHSVAPDPRGMAASQPEATKQAPEKPMSNAEKILAMDKFPKPEGEHAITSIFDHERKHYFKANLGTEETHLYGPFNTREIASTKWRAIKLIVDRFEKKAE